MAEHNASMILSEAPVFTQTAEAHGAVEDLSKKTAIVVEQDDEKSLPAYDEKEIDGTDLYIPDDNEIFIDPRLADYPIPLVAKTVDLHNDPT